MWDTWCGSRTTVCIDGAKLWGSSWTNLTFRSHTSSWPFLNPVDRKAVPDYYEHVKFPMDMKTMAERLKANYYVNKRLFIADMKRMFTNCRSVLYNNASIDVPLTLNDQGLQCSRNRVLQQCKHPWEVFQQQVQRPWPFTWGPWQLKWSWSHKIS